MANDEHISILKRGIEVWNKWRQTHSAIKPDLREVEIHDVNLSNYNLNSVNFRRAKLHKVSLEAANLYLAKLQETDLQEVNLNSANLVWANLTLADLSRAKLHGADLTASQLIRTKLRWAGISGAGFSRANLHGANLSGAELTEANFSEANLTETNLEGSTLIRSIFSGARMQRTIFSKARIGWTTFANNDLSEAIGLDNVVHHGPSDIGIGTIYLSKGNVPESFLRGAGIPDNFIVYMGSLTVNAFEFYSCFISYSSKDQRFVERLYADLQSKGIRCWYAPNDLKIGDKIRVRLDESIRIHDKLLLVLSKHSIESDWVEKEVETALEQERACKRAMLFPIRLDNSVMKIDNGWPADIRRTRYIGDFKHWKDHDAYHKAFNRLMSDLRLEALTSGRA